MNEWVSECMNEFPLGPKTLLTSACSSWPFTPWRMVGPLLLREQISKDCSKVFPATTCFFLPGCSDPVACVRRLGIACPFVFFFFLTHQQQRCFHKLGACRCLRPRDLGHTQQEERSVVWSPFDQHTRINKNRKLKKKIKNRKSAKNNVWYSGTEKS